MLEYDRRCRSNRTSECKLADLDGIAAGRWGPDASVNTLWVGRATAWNRALIHRYPEVFATRFPGSSRAWVDYLTSGADPPTELAPFAKGGEGGERPEIR